MKIQFFVFYLCFLAVSGFSQKKYTPDWESLDSRPTPAWWLDAKFGIFIHWGVYSVPAWCSKGNYAEWYQYGLQTSDTARQAFHKARYGENTSYYEFGKMFNPTLFEPDEWAKLFEKAGAKYVVLTSKHHDGYCLWQSDAANKSWGFPWNSVDCAAKRDLVGDLFTALRKTSVQPGLYYSLYEWFHPLWKTDKKRFVETVTLPQLDDLVQKYQPKIIWADGDWEATSEVWQSQEWLAKLFNESLVREEVVVNDRWGSGVRFKHAGIYTPEYQPNLDFKNHAWEESRGMGFSYGYNREEDAFDYNSAQVLLLHLVDKVSRGGNFLLDIGPDEYGKIPPIMQDRLLEMGEWLQLNGSAIYNTRPWRQSCQWSAGDRNFTMPKNPHFADDWKTGGDVLLKLTSDPDPGYAVKEAFFTCLPEQNITFAILPIWPEGGIFTLKNTQLPAGTLVSFLENNETLKWENKGENVIIQLPVFHPNKIKSKHLWVLKINNLAKFCNPATVEVRYDFNTMEPIINIRSDDSEAQVFYALDGSNPSEKSQVFHQEFRWKTGGIIKVKVFSEGKLASEIVEHQVSIYPKLTASRPTRKLKNGLQLFLLPPVQRSVEEVLHASRGASQEVTELTLPASCATDKCAVIWEGYLQIEETGGYEFYLESDDGSALYIDNQSIINNDGLHSSERVQGFSFLEKGNHAFQIVYFNTGGGADFRLGMRKTSEPQFYPIPPKLLSH